MSRDSLHTTQDWRKKLGAFLVISAPCRRKLGHKYCGGEIFASLREAIWFPLTSASTHASGIIVIGMFNKNVQ